MPREYIPLNDLKLNWDIEKITFNKKKRKNIGYEDDQKNKSNIDEKITKENNNDNSIYLGG